MFFRDRPDETWWPYFSSSVRTTGPIPVGERKARINQAHERRKTREPGSVPPDGDVAAFNIKRDVIGTE